MSLPSITATSYASPPDLAFLEEKQQKPAEAAAASSSSIATFFRHIFYGNSTPSYTLPATPPPPPLPPVLPPAKATLPSVEELPQRCKYEDMASSAPFTPSFQNNEVYEEIIQALHFFAATDFINVIDFSRPLPPETTQLLGFIHYLRKGEGAAIPKPSDLILLRSLFFSENKAFS